MARRQFAQYIPNRMYGMPAAWAVVEYNCMTLILTPWCFSVWNCRSYQDGSKSSKAAPMQSRCSFYMAGMSSRDDGTFGSLTEQAMTHSNSQPLFRLPLPKLGGVVICQVGSKAAKLHQCRAGAVLTWPGCHADKDCINATDPVMTQSDSEPQKAILVLNLECVSRAAKVAELHHAEQMPSYLAGVPCS